MTLPGAANLAQSLAPTWAVMPMAAVTLLVVSAHLLVLARAQMPPSRKRIRTANGLVMMIALPIGAFALGLADPGANPRPFVLSWTLTAGLLTIILALAVLDLANSWRLHRRETRALRAAVRGQHAEC